MGTRNTAEQVQRKQITHHFGCVPRSKHRTKSGPDFHRSKADRGDAARHTRALAGTPMWERDPDTAPRAPSQQSDRLLLAMYSTEKSAWIIENRRTEDRHSKFGAALTCPNRAWRDDAWQGAWLNDLAVDSSVGEGRRYNAERSSAAK